MERLKSEIADDRVIRAMERVPRESFVPAESKHMAYEDAPVPIGEGQTISQPFIVALMVQAGEKLGWEAEAPYDAIVVAAAAPKLLRGLMEQMADGGRLVIPVGSMQNQELMKVSRSEDTYSVKTMGACRFVPLIGEDAWPEGQGSG